MKCSTPSTNQSSSGIAAAGWLASWLACWCVIVWLPPTNIYWLLLPHPSMNPLNISLKFVAPRIKPPPLLRYPWQNTSRMAAAEGKILRLSIYVIWRAATTTVAMGEVDAVHWQPNGGNKFTISLSYLHSTPSGLPTVHLQLDRSVRRSPVFWRLAKTATTMKLSWEARFYESILFIFNSCASPWSIW